MPLGKGGVRETPKYENEHSWTYYKDWVQLVWNGIEWVWHVTGLKLTQTIPKRGTRRTQGLSNHQFYAF